MLKFSFSCTILVCLFLGCSKDNTVTQPEPEVSKIVEFSIAKEQDYLSPLYDGVRASLTLTVSRHNLVSGAQVVAWDTIINTRSIREYPAAINPLLVTKTFHNIVESREYLQVSRVIRYVDQNNQVQQNALGESIPAYTNVKRVLIGL